MALAAGRPWRLCTGVWLALVGESEEIISACPIELG